MLNWLRRAFAVEHAPFEPTAEEALLVDRLAAAVVRRGLTAPALLALECSHNLNFVAGQTVVFFSPLLSLLFDPARCEHVARLLERRGCVEYICRQIEHHARGASASAPPAACVEPQRNL